MIFQNEYEDFTNSLKKNPEGVALLHDLVAFIFSQVSLMIRKDIK